MLSRSALVGSSLPTASRVETAAPPYGATLKNLALSTEKATQRCFDNPNLLKNLQPERDPKQSLGGAKTDFEAGSGPWSRSAATY